jgi:hypothetical protein
MGALNVLFALTLLGSPPQEAQPQVPPDAPSTAIEDVLVEGRPLREIVDDFVDEVVAPPPGRGPARWDRKVCVGAANLRRDTAQSLIDRISDIAHEIGLEAGEPGCSPNILVIASDDGADLARALVEARPNAFRPPYAGASRSRAALERFQMTDRPVRWWHVSIPTHADTGEVAVRIPGYAAPMLNVRGSRLRTDLQNDLRRAFVIVDLDDAGAVTFRQLSDYVAMVAFAQIDPDADLSGFPTVLNVFDDPGAAEGLTDWDLSYLRALYDAELNQRSPNAQSGAVGGIMSRDRERAGSETPE